jgi:hypothetical protein
VRRDACEGCLQARMPRTSVCRGRASSAPLRAPQIPKSQEAVGGNHAVSGLKFRILRRFLVLGYAVRRRAPFPRPIRLVNRGTCDMQSRMW